MIAARAGACGFGICIFACSVALQQHCLHAKLDAQIVWRRLLRPLGVVARGLTQRNVHVKRTAAAAECGRFECARNEQKLLDERPLPAGRVCLKYMNARARGKVQ